MNIWELECISPNYHSELWNDLPGSHVILWVLFLTQNAAKNVYLCLSLPSLLLMSSHHSPPILLPSLLSFLFSPSLSLLSSFLYLPLISLPLPFFPSPFLPLVPANQSWTYLCRTIWLVQVKKEFCRKCFTFHICILCINQVGFLSFICSLHVILSVIFVFGGIYATFFINIFSFCFWYSAYLVRFFIWILSFSPTPPGLHLDY